VIDPSARLEDGVVVEAYATIGPEVEIGEGTLIGAHAMIGAGVKIGRNSSVGAGTSLIYCYVGDNVVIHPGCHLGQDGFGYSASPAGHAKIPQIGRVLIQHHVEIGAGTTIDRGSLRDTVIGEGTKIDNLVQIGHNVYIGRHCLVLAQCGLAGSLTLEDYVALGAKAGLNNHLTVGEGAQVAAMSGVKDNIPPGERWGGIFARPAKQWMREIKVLERLAQGGSAHLPPRAPAPDREGQT
jgi:UDP-3-O-[3-hydroxymyristoyl] glucosamine N-acyltransferase